MKPLSRPQPRPNYAMTAKQRGRLQALAHQMFGRDREGYEEMLWGQIRKKSSKGINSLEASRVISHLENCLGIKGNRAPGAPAGQAGPPRITDGQLWEIRELWSQVSRAEDKEKALRSFLARIQKVIEALKAMALRQALKSSGGN